MIDGVAFCPHPPLLVPELSGNGALEVADLRSACTSALRRAGIGVGSRVVCLSASGRVTAPSGVALAGYGGPSGHSGTAPLPLAIARYLLAGLDEPPPDVREIDAEDDLSTWPDSVWRADNEPVVLLVMGDGSARRGEKAPGYLDPRAEPFDTSVRDALATGDPGTLAALDPVLGAELLAAGVPAWRRAGQALAECGSAGQRWSAELHYAGDPFGVSYFAASWRPQATGAR